MSSVFGMFRGGSIGIEILARDAQNRGKSGFRYWVFGFRRVSIPLSLGVWRSSFLRHLDFVFRHYPTQPATALSPDTFFGLFRWTEPGTRCGVNGPLQA